MKITKKKVVLCSIISIILIGGIILAYNLGKSDSPTLAESKPNKLINNSFLTLMLEQEDGTYKESTSNTWPGEGYIFNSELSSCQNGGELGYDSENNKVILYSNKSDGCYVYFDLYTKPIINGINLGEVTNNSITITVSATNGTNEISNYYYIINDGVPVSTTSNTYTFSGLNSGTTYTIKVYVEDTEGYSSDTSSLNVETDNPILLADWVISQYGGVQGNNGIYYHTSSLANSAGDNSYRYAGADPNNYVCFGSTSSACPSDNLYRIIGVFGSEVKLIKASNYSYESWKIGGDNTWSNSDVRLALNTTYYNSLSATWQNKIATHTWKVGGMTSANGYGNGAKTAYNYEVGSSSASTTDSMKIGLMYVSDYYYGATNTYWTYPGWNSSENDYRLALNSNWILLKSNYSSYINEWSISRDSSGSNSAFLIRYQGYVSNSIINIAIPTVIRPVFYLTSSTTYVSGSGTQSDPIRIT